MSTLNVPTISISTMFNTVKLSAEQLRKGIPVPALNILGEAGIGKSQGLKAAGVAAGIYKDNIVVKNLAEIGDPAELLGYPDTTVKVIYKPFKTNGVLSVNQEDLVVECRYGEVNYEISNGQLNWEFTANNLFDGKCIVDVKKENEEGKLEVYKSFEVTGHPSNQFVSKELIPHIDSSLVERVDYEQTAMTYAPPAWVRKVNEASARGEQSMLILDDYTRATPTILACVMELVNQGKYGDWSLPSDCVLALTSNPDNGVYTVTGQDGAGKSRMRTYNMIFKIKEWAEWCYDNKHKVDERVVDWLLLNPELMSNDSIAKGAKSDNTVILNPRSATNAAYSVFGVDSSEEDILFTEVAANIGTEATHSFITFLKQKFDLPKMDKMFSVSTSQVEAFKAIQAAGYTENKGKLAPNVPAQMIMSLRMLSYVRSLEKIDSTIINKLEYLLTNTSGGEYIFSQENIVHMLTKLNRESRFNKLCRKPGIIKMITQSR